MKWLKSIFLETISVEGTYRIGRYNLKAVAITFVVWLVSIVAGLTLNYIPYNGAKFWEGFSFQVGDGVPLFLTAFLLLATFGCPIALVIARRKGWIEKDDY